jgi:uncharacterized protein (TIGR03435 family)
MVRPLATIVLCACLCAASAGADDSALTFEAVSVKPFPEGAPIQMSGCQGGPGGGDPIRIDCEYISLRMLLVRAYGVKGREIFGPGVLDSEHFNIIAKVPAGATKEQVPAMFRSFLADRFKVTLHHESRALQGYSLQVAKSGLKMKESGPDVASDDEASLVGGKLPVGEDGFPILRKSLLAAGPIIFFRQGRARLQASQTSLSTLATSLSNQLDRVVVDQTLPGKYDMTLYWAPDATEPGGRQGAAPDGASTPETNLFGAIEQQLGLKLVSAKITRDTLVVDHAEKLPTEN